MLRHRNTVHKSRDEEELKSNSSDPESMDEDSENESVAESDSDSWDSIVSRAFNTLQPQFVRDVKSLQTKEHIDEEEARARIFGAMKSAYRKAIMENFMARMQWWCDIQQDPLFRAIKKTASQLMELEDYDRSEAWKYATSKRKYLFDNLLCDYNPPEIDSEDV